jgi:hypothetical protein
MAEGIAIQIGDEQFKALLRETILASLTTEVRERLLQEALTQVITRTIEKGNGYSIKDRENPSVVETTFARTVADVASETVRDLVMNDPEIRPRVEVMVRDVLLNLVSREGAADVIATALWSAVEQVRYR